ncbi:hypothetical protein QBC35DRAFT_195874 [Podospora australis]|uniref:Apple domain-containing protein n=1 Tax=Podospora australis TaxID=1536484 RepID=A0AAN7AIG7_9PEZI|nr:hypothetical protein QBC35DRAFT_195874 [Podospora australis]
MKSLILFTLATGITATAIQNLSFNTGLDKIKRQFPPPTADFEEDQCSIGGALQSLTGTPVIPLSCFPELTAQARQWCRDNGYVTPSNQLVDPFPSNARAVPGQPIPSPGAGGAFFDSTKKTKREEAIVYPECRLKVRGDIWIGQSYAELLREQCDCLSQPFDSCDITYDGGGPAAGGNAVDNTLYTATGRECCESCISRKNCLASAFQAEVRVGNKGLCQHLVKYAPLDGTGVEVTNHCPLGRDPLIDGPIRQPNKTGNVYAGRCFAAESRVSILPVPT